MSYIEVVTAASNRKLTTFDAVNEQIGADPDQRGVIENLILAASRLIEKKTDRVFAKERVIERLTAAGGTHLFLSRRPIITLNSVAYADNDPLVEGTDFEVLDAEGGVLYREDGWTSTGVASHYIVRQPIHERRPDWAVDYDGGYVLPGDAGTRTLPEDLEQACIDLVKQYYEIRDRDPGIASEKIGQAAITYGRSSAGLPMAVASTLDFYKDVEIF